MAKEGFWTDISTEPKRSYRFILYMGGIPQWIIKKVDKPTFKITETKHSYINHTFWYPGRVEWDPITVTLVDPLTPDASKTIEEIVRASGYHFPLNKDDVTTISKKKAVQSLGRVLITQVSTDTDETVEEIELVNPWVQNVKYGSLTYEDDEMVNVELTIRFDYAYFLKSGPFILPASE